MGFKEFIKTQNWVFAKTYAATAPHEYALREKVNGTDAEYDSIFNN